MNIFGITLSTTDLWLLGGASALAMLLLGIYAPAAVKRRQDASAAYRVAFDDVILNLRENPDCPLAQIASGFHSNHLAAITKFRLNVPVWCRHCFEKDVTHYKETYEVARSNGDVFALALSENTEIARTNRKLYSQAVERLLSHA